MSSCRHTDIQEFDGLRCCLSCGEVVTNETQEFETVSNHSDPSPYQYKRLNYGSSNEIRLVRLYPGQDSNDICCDIVHVNLVDEPAYEAVSYTWATAAGDASVSQFIYCGRQTIAVTKNCEAALRSLRRRASNRLLWIDAICINQADTVERNFQVSLMAMIYSNASQVLVYLCFEDGSTFRATNRIMEYLKGKSLGPNHYISIEEAFSSFISHPYFHRVWILQEVSLARLVVLIAGDHAIHWTADTVQRLLALCQSMDIDIPSVLHYMPGIRPEEEDLLDVLYRGRNSFATDPRDKVFALLGLVPPHVFAALPVDYNLAPEELFTKVALHLIREHNSLNVLKHASSQPLPIAKKAPSWVPDWRVKDTTYLLPPQFEPSQISDIVSSPHIPDLHVLQPISSSLPCSIKGAATVDHAKVYSSTDISTLKSYTSNYLEQYHDTLDHNSIQFPCLRVRAYKLDTIVTQIQRSVDSYTTQVTDLRDSQTTWERLDHNTVLISFDQSRRCSSCTVSEPNNSLYADRSLAEQQGREFERKRLGIQGKTNVFLTVQSRVDVPFILRAVDGHYVLIGECFLYRAMLNHLCSSCGRDAEPWAMEPETIDIW